MTIIKNLPDNPQDLVGKAIKLRPGVSKNTVNNFGIDTLYVFTLSMVDPELPIDARIRLFPVMEWPDGRVHLLATIMGYEKMKLIFQVNI